MSDVAEESNEIRTEKWPLDLSTQSLLPTRSSVSRVMGTKSQLVWVESERDVRE